MGKISLAILGILIFVAWIPVMIAIGFFIFGIFAFVFFSAIVLLIAQLFGARLKVTVDGKQIGYIKFFKYYKN